MSDFSESEIRRGILAIWNDCAKGEEAFYEQWYREEHMPERLAIPGFLLGRRFRSIAGQGPAYFTYYEVTDADVLFSPAYRERLDNPTAWTIRAMSGVLTNMNRTICTAVETRGRMRGSYAVTLTAEEPEALLTLADELPEKTALQIQIWAADPRSEGSANAEQKLRGPDRQIPACLLVETATAAEARNIAAHLEAATGDSPGTYELLCDMAR